MVYNKEMVDNYYEMMEEYNNDFILKRFCETIPHDKSVLELGFGTGKDYLYLKSKYQITASDYSDDFINKFEQSHDDQILKINAVDMDIDEKFDCIYSSKVLNSLDKDEIIQSLNNQYQCLNHGGYIFHTLWYGDLSEDNSYIDKQFITKVLATKFEYIELEYYKEADFNTSEFDSLILIARKL